MLLNSLTRSARVSTSLSNACTRATASSTRGFQSSTRHLIPIYTASHQPPMTSQSPSRMTHAISNPTLAGIEKRWDTMHPQEQAELWMQLRDRMKVDWNEMTLQEKKVAWWVAFGPHGPRAETPPGEWKYISMHVVFALSASLGLFILIRTFAKPPPKTMTKEWQEATNEYLKSEKINPIYGISSEGYQGKGYVQSKSAKEQGIELDD